MLDIINNFQNDQNLDVFNKICIYKASHFFGFDRFTGISELETILTTVSDAADILLLNLLPDNLQVKFNSVVRNNSLNYTTNISFIVTPQSPEIKEILNKFQNQEVFVCLQKNNFQHLYGTSKQPLLLTINELNNVKHGRVKGFSIRISGNTLEPSRFIELTEIEIISKLLSAPLVSSI